MSGDSVRPDELIAAGLIGLTLPGFSDRSAAQPDYEAWHVVFAMLRAAAISDRQARTALALGVPYNGGDVHNNPVLA